MSDGPNNDENFIIIENTDLKNKRPSLEIIHPNNSTEAILEVNTSATVPMQNGTSSYTSLEVSSNSDTGMDEESHQIVKSLSDGVTLSVKVDSPEKHVEGYVSYNVTTQTRRSDFDSTDYSVRRRYQDFVWLRGKLEESHPTHIIPPLPDKFTFTKHMTDKYDQDFLKTRQKALHKFMSRVTEHAVLAGNENLKTFLTAKAWEMTTARKDAAHPKAHMKKADGVMRGTAAQLMLKNREEEFIAMAQYNTQFQSIIKNLTMIGDNIATDRCSLLDDYAEYASAFRLWSNSETKLAETLNTLSDSLDKQSNNLKTMLSTHESRMCEPLREYYLYCDSIKQSLKRRDQMQMEDEMCGEELAKRKKEKEELEEGGPMMSLQTFLGKDPEEVRQEKLEKLTQQISDLTTKGEMLREKHQAADQDIKADMEMWQVNKMRDLKALFIEIADRHIKFYEKNVDTWQDSLEVVKKAYKGERMD